MTDAVTAEDRMQCMEVWGGSSPVDRQLRTPGLQLWVHSKPFENASNGGDVYYLSSCASGRITRLLLADVSGHGAGAAGIATDLRTLMRRNINLIDQSRFVSEMNQQFADRICSDEFATALVCTFFSPTRSLQFCSAGHPTPFLYRAKLAQWTLAVDAVSRSVVDGISDTPLGVIEDADFTKYEIRLDPGDMILCVTDAFIEATDEHLRVLGMNGLLRIMQQLDASQPSSLILQIRQTLQHLHPENLQQDDATVLLFRADGTAPSLGSDLMAPMRMLRGVRYSR